MDLKAVAVFMIDQVEYLVNEKQYAQAVAKLEILKQTIEGQIRQIEKVEKDG